METDSLTVSAETGSRRPQAQEVVEMLNATIKVFLLVSFSSLVGCAYSAAAKPYCDRIVQDTGVTCNQQRADVTGAPPAGVGEHRVIASTATIPISFVRLQKDMGAYHLGTAMDLGLGYTFMLGTITYNPNGDTVQIQPAVVFGAAFNGGARESTTGATGEFGPTLFVGLGPIAFSVGRDLDAGAWAFGLNLKVDAFTFKKDSYTVWKTW